LIFDRFPTRTRIIKKDHQKRSSKKIIKKDQDLLDGLNEDSGKDMRLQSLEKVIVKDRRSWRSHAERNSVKKEDKMDQRNRKL
jgi:hypothetical protein